MLKEVTITEVEYQELKKLYTHSVENNIEQFEWMGAPVLTKYAKYLLEHLATKFE